MKRMLASVIAIASVVHSGRPAEEKQEDQGEERQSRVDCRMWLWVPVPQAVIST